LSFASTFAESALRESNVLSVNSEKQQYVIPNPVPNECEGACEES